MLGATRSSRATYDPALNAVRRLCRAALLRESLRGAVAKERRPVGLKGRHLRTIVGEVQGFQDAVLSLVVFLLLAWGRALITVLRPAFGACLKCD